MKNKLIILLLSSFSLGLVACSGASFSGKPASSVTENKDAKDTEEQVGEKPDQINEFQPTNPQKSGDASSEIRTSISAVVESNANLAKSGRVRLDAQISNLQPGEKVSIVKAAVTSSQHLVRISASSVAPAVCQSICSMTAQVFLEVSNNGGVKYNASYDIDLLVTFKDGSTRPLTLHNNTITVEPVN